MGNSNRYLEAFKENFNVIGLSTAVALSAATLNPLPLLVGLVAEAVYLMFVPDTKWYEARLSERFDAEIDRRRDELKAKVIPSLRPEMQARFERMEYMYRGIKSQQADDPVRTATGWFREVLRKLEFLMEKFLQFASKEVQFRLYLFSVLHEVRNERRVGANTPSQNNRGNARGNGNRRGGEDDEQDKLWDSWIAEELKQRRKPSRHQPPRSQPPPTAAPPPPDVPSTQVQQMVEEIQQHYDKELDHLRQLHAGETDPGTKAVLEKRVEVLQRRRDFIGKIGKVLMNLNHQLLLLEDTLGLISDEIRARPPEQVLADIEDVVWQTKTMTELLEEVAPFESAISSSTTI